jgi:hypothetical protein
LLKHLSEDYRIFQNWLRPFARAAKEDSQRHGDIKGTVTATAEVDMETSEACVR